MATGLQTYPVLAEKTLHPAISRFTPQQRRILAALGEGLTVSDIVEKLGITRQRVHQVIDATRGKVADVMDDAGLNDTALVQQYLKPALNAMETEFAKFQGTITDSREVIAWGPRLQALELAAKLKGLVRDKEPVNVGIAVNVLHTGGDEE